MSIQRDGKRLFHLLKKRFQVKDSDEQKVAIIDSSAVEKSVSVLAFWLLPALFFFFWGLASFSLFYWTHPKETNMKVIVFPSKLPNAGSILASQRVEGKYFSIHPTEVPHRYLMQSYHPDTMVFETSSTFASLQGLKKSKMDFVPPLCNEVEKQLWFHLPNAKLATLCFSDSFREKMELRFQGWIAPQNKWKKGLSVGSSIYADLIATSKGFPLRALKIEKRGNGFVVRSIRQKGSDLAQLCLQGKTKNCETVLSVAVSEVFSFHAKGFPERSFSFALQPSSQRKNHYELLNQGNKREKQVFPSLGASEKALLFGSAFMYFRDFWPQSVETTNLSNLWNPLFFSKMTNLRSGTQLQEHIQRSLRQEISLEEVFRQAPDERMKKLLLPLQQNAFLRARIFLFNYYLAENRVLQAKRTFYFKQSEVSNRPELISLGTHAITLQAPRKNLLNLGQKARNHEQNLHLKTSIQARRTGHAFLEIRNQETEEPKHWLFPTKKGMEVLTQESTSILVQKKGYEKASLFSFSPSVLWVEKTLFERKDTLSEELSTVKWFSPQDKQFTVFSLPSRWWSRKKGIQKSSRHWPLEGILETYGEEKSKESLRAFLLFWNKERIQQERFCGTQSRKKGRKWSHRKVCWEKQAFLSSKSLLILPCNSWLKKKTFQTHCTGTSSAYQMNEKGGVLAKEEKDSSSLYGLVFRRSQQKEEMIWEVKKRDNTLDAQWTGGLLPSGKWIQIKDGDRFVLGSLFLRFRNPGSNIVVAQIKKEKQMAYYPWESVFSHLFSSASGGFFRHTERGLKENLPYPKQEKKKELSFQFVSTLEPKLQHLSFLVGSQHLQRMDSKDFQTFFRRRFVNNPNKPHGGAISVVHRKTGELLSAVSFPLFDPNWKDPKEQPSKQSYLSPQIVDPLGVTNDLLAYLPHSLPPIQKKKSKTNATFSALPTVQEAIELDQEESKHHWHGDEKSGWLQERTMKSLQTPGSTAKIVTAIAYARYLEKTGKPASFPSHTCSGGLLFQRKHKEQWKKSSVHFRCHKKEGHGVLTFEKALASSCNVYFAKLALEMAGVSPSDLRKGSVSWHRGKNSGNGKYQFLQIEPLTLSQKMGQSSVARELFRTASDLGVAMNYSYYSNWKKKEVSSYRDVFWEGSTKVWDMPPKTEDPVVKKQKNKEWIQQHFDKYFPFGSFGKGSIWGLSSVYPAWQQWVHQSKDPRNNLRMSVTSPFGSTLASLRAMAYVGFGQNISISPLRLSYISAAIANNGWMPAPMFWLKRNEEKKIVSRPPPRKILKKRSATLIRNALLQVTQTGTAALPFRKLNKECLSLYGLAMIGKTGTAETRSSKSRNALLQKVKSQRGRFYRGNQSSWLQQTGCHRRSFWQMDYPEENIADSLFTGSIVRIARNTQPSIPSIGGIPLENLSMTALVKNGYHPQGAPCRKKGVDSDRTEAKYVVHDLVVALLHQGGFCPKYQVEVPQFHVASSQSKKKQSKKRSKRRKKSRKKKTTLKRVRKPIKKSKSRRKKKK